MQFKLIDQCHVRIDFKLLCFLEISPDDNIFNGNLLRIILNKIMKRNCRFVTNKRICECCKLPGCSLNQRKIKRKRFIQAKPRTTTRINFVWFKFTIVLEHCWIDLQEIPNNFLNFSLGIYHEIIMRWSNIENSPARKLSWIHVSDSVCVVSLSTIDTSNDNGIWMKPMTSKLAAIGQLEKRLTHILTTAINLVKVQNASFNACLMKPFHRKKTCRFSVQLWQSHEITSIWHLRCSTFHNWINIVFISKTSLAFLGVWFEN